MSRRLNRNKQETSLEELLGILTTFSFLFEYCLIYKTVLLTLTVSFVGYSDYEWKFIPSTFPIVSLNLQPRW